MTSLQLGLIVGGVVLVVGVLIYNWVQERRVRRKIASTFAKPGPEDSRAPLVRGGSRVEPTLDPSPPPAAPQRDAAIGANLAQEPPEEDDIQAADEFVPPIDFAPRVPPDFAAAAASRQAAQPDGAPDAVGAPLRAPGSERLPHPDPDIECVITLQPVRPVQAGAIAAAMHARVGKPLRWFGRESAAAPWHLLKSDTDGEWRELCACFLLADRAGAATRPLVDRFIRVVSEQAAALPAAFVAPEPDAEVSRAEALDRICADLDVQIGLTVLKAGATSIQGTRLRGVAEAAGFRLADNGRFEWVQEDAGGVLYSLQNFRNEPFTADSLRLTSTPGAVFILDVPRVVDPVRVFDQMKLAAKRMTQTLDAALVDDNRRPLNDAALAAIRHQVQTTAAALKEIRVEPGSPRALALFGG